MIEETRKKISREGARAYKKGAQEIDNPYFGKEAEEWEAGWHEEKKKGGFDSVRGFRP